MPPPQAPERLPIAEATAKVAAHLRKAKPKAKVGDDFAVLDATTDELWKKLHVQVVKVKAGLAQNESFVVQGDMLPEVEHWSNSYEIVEYLRALQPSVAPIEFEVGMSTRSRQWQFRRRVNVGGQFFTTGPVMDPASVEEVSNRLDRKPDDPPVYLEITPPMSVRWVKRLESVGAIPISDDLRERHHRDRAAGQGAALVERDQAAAKEAVQVARPGERVADGARDLAGRGAGDGDAARHGHVIDAWAGAA